MNGTPKSTNFQQVENSPRVPRERRPKGKTTEQKGIIIEFGSFSLKLRYFVLPLSMLLVLLINNNCDYNEQK